MGKAINKAKEIAAEIQEAEQAAAAPAEDIQPEFHAVTLDELEALDMDALASQEEGRAPRDWHITDDACADWAVQKIATERAELARIKALADEQISRIMEKVQAAEKRCENGTAYLTGKLAEYFETVPQKKTKTQRSYRLLSGVLKVKIGSLTMKQDDEKLLEYLKASGNSDMIQLVEKPKWGEFKKRLEIVGGQIVDNTTGEIVEGVEVITKPDTFHVEV